MSKLDRVLRDLRRFFKRPPEKEDPYAKVRVPRKKGPGGLSASVALEEPKQAKSIDLRGR